MIPYSGKNRRTVNYLKTIYFDEPEWTPCSVSLMMATWMKYRDELEGIVLAHPKLFPGFKKGSVDYEFPNASPLYQSGYHTDSWGCVWRNIRRGLDSIVEVHPLEDWAAFDSWKAPDPLKDDEFGPRGDWSHVKVAFDAGKARGELATGGGLPHGFLYMRLYYLRGFENLMTDMATGDPRLRKLIAIIERYNVTVVRKYLEAGAEFMSFGEDLGMQKSLPISPAMWRKYIKPTYEAMFGPCRDRDIPVYLHSDGHILEIIPDLIETGVRVINPQIRANGLVGIKEAIKGKMAMNLDLDRQLFPFASPGEIEDHIGEAHETLSMREGGLMLHAECEPDVSLENIEVICRVLEKVCNPPDPDVR